MERFQAVILWLSFAEMWHMTWADSRVQKACSTQSCGVWIIHHWPNWCTRLCRHAPWTWDDRCGGQWHMGRTFRPIPPAHFEFFWPLTYSLSCQKGLIACHVKRDICLFMSKGTYSLLCQKGLIAYHVKRDMSKGMYFCHVKNGYIDCYVKWRPVAGHVKRDIIIFMSKGTFHTVTN